jgi:hypothetical protein
MQLKVFFVYNSPVIKTFGASSLICLEWRFLERVSVSIEPETGPKRVRNCARNKNPDRTVRSPAGDISKTIEKWSKMA